VAEFDVAGIAAAEPAQRAPDIPRFPAVMRDIALIVPDDELASTVLSLLREAGGPLLSSASLFDVYRGEPVPAGSVSLAFALAFRDAERTLTDADAEAAMTAIEHAVGDRGWSIRT
jgi:phenylalanyl-tRNA synthetase beta chain